MLNKVKILAVGDIIGKGARNAFINYLPTLKEKYNYDIIIVNAENSTHGRGLNKKHYDAYKKANVDVLTMGNHVIDNEEIYDYIDKTNNLVVPGNVNFEKEVLNSHKEAIINFNGKTIKIINLLGTFGNTEKFKIESPLEYFDKLFEKDSQSIYIIDYHAELTLEKNLLGYYVDGRASLVYGTHTHVQTADERILPNKTGFITDIGMCGSVDSVIGYDYNSYLERIKNGTRSVVSVKMPMMINGIFVEIDLDTKQTIRIERINETL